MKHELTPVIRSEKKGANMDTVIDHVNEKVAKLRDLTGYKPDLGGLWRLETSDFSVYHILDN